MQFKTDKRSMKTRKAIKIAFLKLVKTIEINEISITELTTLANINRNSFYTHYKSVENILDDINEEILYYLEQILQKHSFKFLRSDPYPIMREFSNLAVSNSYISEYLLFSKSSNNLLRKLKDKICDRFHELYREENGNDNPYIKYILAYIISGVFEIYHVWFRNNKEIDIEEITKQISLFVATGLKTY